MRGTQLQTSYLTYHWQCLGTKSLSMGRCYYNWIHSRTIRYWHRLYNDRHVQGKRLHMRTKTKLLAWRASSHQNRCPPLHLIKSQGKHLKCKVVEEYYCQQHFILLHPSISKMWDQWTSFQSCCKCVRNCQFWFLWMLMNFSLVGWHFYHYPEIHCQLSVLHSHESYALSRL
jgi:hypothetical protein